jgi:hypothetical protein
MSFAINPSLNHINLPETYIDALYRSTSEVQLPDARFRGHPCEAYICISKIEKTMKAYVALLDMGLKSVLVYTSDFESVNPADYPKVEAQAQEFVKTMGFTMEKVNLEFSPAMREVIIKGFRVMRPPPPPKKQAGRYPKPEYSADQHLLNIPTNLEDALLNFQIDELPAELTSLRAELASARAVIEKLAREKVSTEQGAILEIAALKTAVEQANESRRKSEENFAQELQKLRAQQSTSQTLMDDDEKIKLQAQVRKGADDASASEDRLRKQMAELQEKNRSLEAERVKIELRLASENSVSDAKIAELTAKNESLKIKLSEEQAANFAASDKITALALFETSWKEGQLREEDLCRNIDLMKMQIDAMENDLQSYRDREKTEESLALKVRELETAAEAAKSELEQLRNSAVDAGKYLLELKALEDGKNVIESEYVRLANESREQEIELSDALSSAEAEVHRLSRELDIQTQVAAMEQSALRTELRRIVMEGVPVATQATTDEPPVIAKPAPLPPVDLAVRAEPSHTTPPVHAPEQTVTAKPEEVQTLQEVDITEEDSDEPDLPVKGYPEIVSGLINEFGSFYSESGHASTDFSIDPSITSIEYSDPAEIVALLYSSNTVQAVPVGSSIQRCKGYVIGMMRSGTYLTYIIWYLTESKKSVICIPQQQPEDSSECIRTLQDAVSYFETVGFMMEYEELGSSTKSYKKALKKVPALKMKATG